MRFTSNKTAYLFSMKPRLFAHRGFAKQYPENTIGAFQDALSAGADYIESDIQLTNDGIPVLCHDPDLASYGIQDFTIADHSLAELQKQDIGHGQRISTLEEILNKFPDTHFNLDLKTPNAVSKTLEIIHKTKAQNRVLLASFQHTTIKKIRKANPEIVTSASQKEVIIALLLHRLGLGFLLSKVLKNVVALQIPAKFAGINLAGKRWIKAVQKSSTEIHYWTINDANEAKQLIDLGADGIVSDRTDLIFKMFQQTQLR